MSDSKQSQQKWRAEELRDQRKARLAGMKSKTGGKKPIRTGNKAAVLITALILVVVLAAGGIWWVVNLGIPQRTVAALAIGGENITAAEFNYYYYSQLSYYSIDPSTDAGKTTLAGTYDENFATVGDYLKDQAAKELQQTVVLCQAAKAANVMLDETDMETVDSYMSNIENYATADSKSVENYLIANYGKGVNENVMRGILERYVLSDKYTKQLQDAYGFTDADIQKYYDENKDDFDVVTYRSFYIASVTATDATDEEKKTALAAAKAKANEMFGKISSEATFKAMCIEYAADEEEKKEYTDEDASLTENALLSDIYSEDQSTWLFAEARSAGDKIVIESTTGYYVLYFVSREQNTAEHVSVRHILIEAARETATEAEISAAKTKAESILAGYMAGAKTEDAFAALVADNTADTGSAATGGLYSDISPSSSYVEEFLAWAVDDSRKAGDTGIVQTDYGFHIMYFVGVDSIEWKLNVKNTLVSEKYNAYLEELVKAKPYTFNSFGLRFVG